MCFSGFSSTGFTVFDNIKHIDQGLILWRSSIQWIGGLYFLYSIIFLIDIYDESLKKSLTNFLSFNSAEILKQSENLLNLDLQKLNVDKNLVNRVMNHASVKHIISKNFNDDEKIIEIFTEIIQDLKNYELEQRIIDLESKFSKDLSEATFNELKKLKKLQKIN